MKLTEYLLAQWKYNGKPWRNIGHMTDWLRLSLGFDVGAWSCILRCNAAFKGKKRFCLWVLALLMFHAECSVGGAPMSKSFEEMKSIGKSSGFMGKNPTRAWPAFPEKSVTWVQYKSLTSGGSCAMKECRHQKTERLRVENRASSCQCECVCICRKGRAHPAYR